MNTKYEVGSLILRLVVGITFLVHGLIKFQSGIDNIAGWFTSIGLPGFAAYAIAIIEVAGGIALIAGIGTRVVSVLFGLIMVGAILKVKLAAGFAGNGQMAGYELDLVLLAISIHLAISGSKLYSLGSLFGSNTKNNA
ncbi:MULTISPECIES: DoxX family protein [unclassified Paenibacillus]|uniref:DoxX family protein n=1 Tax=unclassified Paenibacillus TaxID=185978 RepID=UPI001AE46E68|nr:MULTISPECIES: DoxX family protein [unclassified Paenibacillus]MBP1153777.1 putative membrane protein YphA (DoxX/SURF4 family) [Paenibacillus sp. PvP091]MBP1170838.1 putative membrane protein YphA (DoxX/SURF4 family) [Paenibacillus sp. PvR098]MBP2441866.1 putative membrane protein YphA (DoxX/SURF4 family) [Paenibacillus sp. PvP052]